MLYFWSILCPPMVFFLTKQTTAGLINFCLWITCCGAPFASGWALFAASQWLDDERTREITDAIRDGSRAGQRRDD